MWKKMAAVAALAIGVLAMSVPAQAQTYYGGSSKQFNLNLNVQQSKYYGGSFGPGGGSYYGGSSKSFNLNLNVQQNKYWGKTFP